MSVRDLEHVKPGIDEIVPFGFFSLALKSCELSKV